MVFSKFMSRELIFGIYTKKKRKAILTKEQEEKHSALQEMFKAYVAELCFLIKSQPSPILTGRPSEKLLLLTDTVTNMLNNRHRVRSDVFENDQIELEKMIEVWKNVAREEYRALYEFLLSVKEAHAYDGFRSMFDLEDVDMEEGSSISERHRNRFADRRYSWLNGPPGTYWLYSGLEYYNTSNNVRSGFKTKILTLLGRD
ncbi:unnamed protein product [Caenorhabditis sp. 36 PRJEB53466]|nr:unnamed protein product [Caenorhabditis sp. 36 PRJEB53466]